MWLPWPSRDVPIYQEWVGSLDGNVNAVIKPQVSGYLIKQNYSEGEVVNKGQVLFEIDPRTFQAVLNQTSGSLDQARGDLARARGAYVTARAELARVKPLAAKNAVSKKDLDDAIGRELAARASVEAAKAAIVAATPIWIGPVQSWFYQNHLPGGRHRRHCQDPAGQPGRPVLSPGIDLRVHRRSDQGLYQRQRAGIFICGTAVRSWRRCRCN